MSKAKMTKQDYYESMLRNRYYLWAFSSNVCTMDNLDDVKQGRLYVPMYDEVHLEPCPRPPLKQFVLHEIKAELAIKERQRLRELQQNQTHSHDAQQLNQNQVPEGSQEEFLKRRMYRMNLALHHQPDLAWCLAVLSTLNRKHRFFAKDYTPSKEELGNRGKPRKVHESPLNVDPFYKDLPQHLGKKIPRYIRLEEDEQSEEDGGSVEDVFGEVEAQGEKKQKPYHSKIIRQGGAKSHRAHEEAKAQEHQQKQTQIKKQKAHNENLKQQVIIKKKQYQQPPQQLFQGGYQQQSQSPVRYDKGNFQSKANGNGNGNSSKATTQHSSNRKDPHTQNQPYDRFEDSGFLIPISHQSVFAEGNGLAQNWKGGQGGGTSSQHVTPMKPNGLYKDPTIISQRSDQTMRSAQVKDQPQGSAPKADAKDVHMDATSSNGRGGVGGLGGFLGGLSGGPNDGSNVTMQNGVFKI